MTTFTLSLTWFESYLLRHFEHHGTRDIALLTDPVGMADAVGEGLAAGPGVRYALEAVELPGAFHPKVALMWSGQSILMAVGSGNLTFPGMSRNLEIWDVLGDGFDLPAHRRLSASVLAGLSGFLTFLVGQTTGSARQTVIHAQRVIAGRKGRDSGPIWLDNTRRSIGEQLVEHLPARRGRQLRVLSPFHDPTGGACQRLARELGAAEIEILFTGDNTTFPLHSSSAVPLKTARLLHAGDRPLHAKLFHIIDSDQEYILAGSANATQAALWGTNNLEVSLLRRGPPGAFDALVLTEVATPQHQPMRITPALKRRLRILQARASGEGVDIRLRWESPPDRLILTWPESIDEAVELPVMERCQVAPPSSFDPLRPVAHRCRIEGLWGATRSEALAWLSFDALLRLHPRERQARSAWARLLHGGIPDEADARLLEAFSSEHTRVMSWLSRPAVGRGTSTEKKPPAEPEPIPVQLLDALSQSLPVGSKGHRSSPSTMIQSVTAAMRLAFRGRQNNDHGGGSGGKRRNSPPRLHPSVRDALERFQTVFLEEASAVDMPADPEAVMGYTALCVEMTAHYWLLDGDEREGFWRSIDRIVRVLLCPRTGRAPLLSEIHGALPDTLSSTLCALLAALYWRRQGNRLPGVDLLVDHGLLSVPSLRGGLAVLEQQGVAVVATPPSLLVPLLPGGGETIQGSLEALKRQVSPWARPTVLHRLLKTVNQSDFRYPRGMLEDEKSLFKAARRGAPWGAVAPWISECPCCRQDLSVSVTQELLLGRPVQCTSLRCRAWMLPSEVHQ